MLSSSSAPFAALAQAEREVAVVADTDARAAVAFVDPTARAVDAFACERDTGARILAGARPASRVAHRVVTFNAVLLADLMSEIQIGFGNGKGVRAGAR